MKGTGSDNRRKNGRGRTARRTAAILLAILFVFQAMAPIAVQTVYAADSAAVSEEFDEALSAAEDMDASSEAENSTRDSNEENTEENPEENTEENADLSPDSPVSDNVVTGSDDTSAESADTSASDGTVDTEKDEISQSSQKNAAESEKETEEETKKDTPENENEIVSPKELKKSLKASDGNTYEVIVSCKKEGIIPAGSELEFFELNQKDAKEYIKASAEEIGVEEENIDFSRAFDIKIVDQKDHSKEYEPNGDVEVMIRLGGESLGKYDNVNVLHFVEDEKSDQVTVEDLDLSVRGEKVEFTTDSFSVYVVTGYSIVDGPQAASAADQTITTMEELDSNGSTGVYMGNTGGFYFTNSTYNVNNSSRTGIRKTKPATDKPTYEASLYYFEKAGDTGKYYIYCYSTDNVKQYLRNRNNNSMSFTDVNNRTAFNVTVDESGRFKINNGSWYVNMQGGVNGDGFAAYNNATDPNNYFYIWKPKASDSDVYGIDGTTYGLVRYTGDTTGKALMAESSAENRLDAMTLTALTKVNDRTDAILVPKDSGISMWTFTWVREDKYTVSAEVDGSTKYLKVTGEGISLSDEETIVRVIPGTGENENKIRLESGGSAVVYSGTTEGGFASGTASSANAWLNFAELSEITSDYVKTYSAKKVSVSDPSVTNGSRIIVYTRTWNNKTKKYDFFAIDSDGSLVPCYESGDSIQWVGTSINTLLWNFAEYYWEGTTDPNYYYDLYNQYSKKYIAPRIADGQILSDESIGINLNGRRYGDYYSTILAWDDPYYAYAGLKVEGDHIASGPMAQSEDFYFAIMQDIPEDDELTGVPTVDHEQYGITMKLVNFDDNADQNAFLGNSTYVSLQRTTPDLLSTNIGSDGYPTNSSGTSLGTLFAGASKVNHLFIGSTYSGTGYYEFDSTQNFATLSDDGRNFTVYKELGTHDASSKPTLKHGQFFPYNDLTPGVFAVRNPENLYNARAEILPETDPRKYERLHLIQDPDYYFGVEIEASFVQTPSGLDAWGHDIIYEFTGDDDFWLYVDGELIIDLGGIHSALPGSVNYSTGEVSINGTRTTLKQLFYNNCIKRGQSAAQAQAYVNSKFEQNDRGEWVFKDYSSHTMRIFFMERGAGASNLHMRFNLSSVKPGQILLSKEISGTDKADYRLAEYAYQIWYQLPAQEEGGEPVWKLLDNSTTTISRINVAYQNTVIPVKFRRYFTPAGGTTTYDNVYFLTPGQTAAISLPESAIRYKITECGVNTQVYDKVSVNNEEIAGAQNGENRKDYTTQEDTIEARPRVVFNNHVSETAMRTLSITKRLYDIDNNLITNDPTGFNFRLFLGNENDTDLSAAGLTDYCVKNAEGYYCRWDAASQSFVSIGKDNYGDLTEAEKLAVTFQTSMNGAISKIPAEYKIEVRDLMVGTKFRVEERESEMPEGYSFIRYEREGNSYITNGEAINAGTIRENESPAVEVHNRRGFGLTVKKVWSDASFMENHGDVYFAVFVNDSLIPGTVRRMKSPSTSLYYYFDSLNDGTTIDDYAIREVKLNGSDYTVNASSGAVTLNSTQAVPIEEGGKISVTAKSKEDGTTKLYDYAVSYTEPEIKGSAEGIRNLRTDTVINSRHGIRLMKKDWSGNALSGAEFTLTDASGSAIGAGTYTSDSEGLITIAYINVDTEYTLTETKTPSGYHGMQEALKFRLNSDDNTVEIISGEEGYYELAQASGDDMASITVRNRAFTLKAVKQGIRIDGSEENLSGVHFALHREVDVDGTVSMDFDPMTGYEDLVTNANGVIPQIDQSLAPGTYYLKEKEAAAGYEKLVNVIRFTVTQTGAVILTDAGDEAGLTQEFKADGTLAYTITVKNTQMLPSPTGISTETRAFTWMVVLGILLLAAACVPAVIRRRKA